MKKKGIAVLLALILLLLMPVTASADMIYPSPGFLTVGQEVSYLLATLDPGGTVSAEGQMPEGLYLATKEIPEGINVYLCGTPTTPGSYSLLIHYNDIDSICSFTVLPAEEPEPTPVSVSVETLPLRTEYTAGDMLDPEGLSLRVEMSDGGSQVITEGYALFPILLEEPGTRTIEVNYEGLLCYFDVEVAEVPEVIQGIGVRALPFKVIYQVGEKLDTSGLMIRVYTNKGTRDLFENLVCVPQEFLEPGQQSVTVLYEGFACVFTVQVLAEQVPEAVAVYRLPDKLAYAVGEELDTSGLVLIETVADGEPRYVEEGYVCEPVRFLEPGYQEVTVTLGDLSCSFHVTVLEKGVSEPGSEQADEQKPTAVPTAQQLSPVQVKLPTREPEETGDSAKLLITVIAAAVAATAVILGIGAVQMGKSGRAALAESVKARLRRRR